MDRKRARSLEELVELIKKEYSPELILLFGSRARGDNLITSDYDIIVVSKKFIGIPFLTRLFLMQDLWDGERHLDALCYTPEEYERKKQQMGTVQQASIEGVPL
ncbi:MAG: Nucleotidyltransferase domain protein [Candidatus Methanofastidiosum methylothiophilum]|uniref:Nucleotidyltransferase domain protein n=1 Tax=Candidatus Methanofastidiosum methylothiophilum TaxID=1705564 RepID=A0A150J3U4_9EURY|nr:MAG: Nucleotidyltransferase domain protein [Candidatus Methanofastidiosum methylthiophilus]